MSEFAPVPHHSRCLPHTTIARFKCRPGTIPWALVHSVVAEYSGELIQRNAWLKDKNAEVQFALKYVPALICCSFVRVPADFIRHKYEHLHLSR